MSTHLLYSKVFVPLFLRASILSVIFVISVFFVSSVSAYTSPGKPTGAVNDFAGILSAEERSALEIKVREFQRPAGLEMAVVTVPSLGGETIENYAVKLFAEWGIGQKLKDNGVLLLIAPNEREVRIEVGYGLEPLLTDAESSQIIRTVILPAFKSGDYSGGIRAGIDGIETAVNADPAVVPSEPEKTSSSRGLPGEIFLFALAFSFQLIPVMMRSKSWWLGGVIGLVLGFLLWSLYIGITLAIIGLILDYVLSKKYREELLAGKNPDKMFSGARGWFGGFGGRGGGGGFGGFGGGMSGGGGASGRW